MTIAEALAKLKVTDDFNRNENPIAGAWKLLKPGKSPGKTEAGEEAGYTPVSTFVTGEDEAYWSTTSYVIGSDAVAALARITKIPVTGERQIGLWILRDKTKPETEESGYRLKAEWISGKKIKFVLEKWVKGAITELKKVESEAYGVGSRIAIVASGGKVFFFASKEKESAFEEVASAEDATYTEGYSGVYGKGTGEFKIRNFATGNLELEETAGVHKPNSATATASSPSPEITAPLEPKAATATASSPSGGELAGGPALSSTEHEIKGLPLPFPTVVPNPQRLGPPRFTALERKTLGLDR